MGTCAFPRQLAGVLTSFRQIAGLFPWYGVLGDGRRLPPHDVRGAVRVPERVFMACEKAKKEL